MENIKANLESESLAEIKTFEGYLSEHGGNERLDRMTETLKQIQEKEADGEDPIQFLWDKYFIEKLSAVDIYDMYAKYGGYNNSNKDTFQKLFKLRLNWKLRESSNPTEKIKDKIRGKTTANMKHLKGAKDSEVNNVVNVLKRISKNKNKLDISEDVLDSLRFNSRRIIYVLSQKGYIEENNFEKIVLKLRDKYGSGVTAKAIQTILNEEGFSDMKFTKARISEISNKQKKLA